MMCAAYCHLFAESSMLCLTQRAPGTCLMHAYNRYHVPLLDKMNKKHNDININEQPHLFILF